MFSDSGYNIFILLFNCNCFIFLAEKHTFYLKRIHRKLIQWQGSPVSAPLNGGGWGTKAVTNHN